MLIQDLKSFKLPKNFRGRNAFIVQLWWLVQSILFRTSPQFLYGWRNFLLRLLHLLHDYYYLFKVIL